MTIDLATQRMTAAEFCEWVQQPENTNKWFELERGRVIELPSPMKIHGVVCLNIGFELKLHIRKTRLGYATGNDSGVILERDPDTVRGPDLAYYQDAKQFRELHPKYGEVPPLLAVEVLSPNDRADRMVQKLSDYLRNGVQMVWLVDPETHTVHVYQPNKTPVKLDVSATLTAESVLPGFSCPVANFFLLDSELPAPPDTAS